MKKIQQLLLLASVVTSTAVFAADYGQTPGSYTDYIFDQSVSGFDSVDFAITPDADPGHAANVYWSSQFGFVGSSAAAYTGMQSNGGPKRTFLFSAWGATESRVGSEGSYCQSFEESGSGRTCRITLDWKQGHTYQFHVGYDQHDNWLTVKINDLTDNTSFTLGSIKTEASQISPQNMANWTEYFEWNDERTVCSGQPYSKATFTLPVGYSNGAGYTAFTNSHSSNTCQAYTKITSTDTGTVHENGVGNSLRGAIKNGDVCIGNSVTDLLDGFSATTNACNSSKNQGWVRPKIDSSLEAAYNHCLAADSSSNKVKISSCEHTNPNFQWDIKGTEIRKAQTSLCLTNNGSGQALTLTSCDGSEIQKWDTSELGLADKKA